MQVAYITSNLLTGIDNVEGPCLKPGVHIHTVTRTIS